jgi:hypothetical protein
MQGVEIEFAQQMAAGNQRNGNSSRVTARPMGWRYLLNRSSKRRRSGLIGCSL